MEQTNSSQKTSHADSLHERTRNSVQEVLQRITGHVTGFEQVIVSRAINVVQPRLMDRLQRSSEEDLRTELEYIRELIENTLQDKPKLSAKRKRKRKSGGKTGNRTPAAKRLSRAPRTKK